MQTGSPHRDGAGAAADRPEGAALAAGVEGMGGLRLMPALFWSAWTLACVAAVAVIAIWASRSRAATLAAARGDVVRVASQGAAYVDDIVGLADEILVRLSERTSEADLNTLALDKLCPSLVCADYGRSAKPVLIAFARSDGAVVSAGSTSPPASLADRDYFAALKAADLGLFIGRPRGNRIVAGTYLPMARRLAPKEAAFSGIVAAAIDVELIRTFFQGLGIGGADRIDLRDRQGDLLVGWPAQPEAGARCRHAGLAASERLRIGGLAVDACRSSDNALDAWRRRVLLTAGAAAALLLVPALAFPALQRRRERRLRQQRGLRGLVVEAFDVRFIVAAEPDGRFTLEALTFDRGAAWGAASARLVGRTTRELFPPEDAASIEAQYRAVLASGETWRGERRLRLGGTPFTWSVVLVPLGDRRGGRGHIYGAATDVAGGGSLASGLRRFTENVLRREDDERRRIARELHDTTGQNLIAAGFELGIVARESIDPPPRVRAALRQAQALVGASVTELRTLSYVLYPALLDEAGLATALETLADGFGRRAGIPISVAIADGLAGRRWAPEVELALYRVAQEALTNVQRHSGASTARVILRSSAPGQLELTIEDGADEAPECHGNALPVEGAGIRGMRDRLDALSGTLTISHQGDGIRVAATVPAAAVRQA